MKRLLITGFDPFDGAQVNPSWETVKALPAQVGAYELYKMELPTVYGEAARTLLEEAAKLQPEVILCIGQAGGRSAVTPERIAINIRDARIADNSGYQYHGDPVVEDGPAAYFSTLPVAEMARAIADAGVPGIVSNSAGAFVCNDTLYTLLHYYADTHVRVGFIHIPYLPEQGSPSLPLCDAVTALTAAINAL